MVAQIDKAFIRTSLIKTYARLVGYLLYEGRPLTTKGRWINHIVFFLYKIQSRFPFPRPVSKPIFILGTGRSGTTILGVTLGVHTDVGFLNEPKALWSYIYANEDLIGSYNSGNANYFLTEDDVTESAINKAHRIFGHYLRVTFSNRLVDKYPELIFRTGFVKKIFPDAKFIFLYRDGRDTCHSINLWSQRLGTDKDNEVHDWWGRDDRKWRLLCAQVVANDEVLGAAVELIANYTDHMHRAAVEWIVTMKQGLQLVSEQPNSVLGVKYEDYVAQKYVRDNVLNFCELAPDNNYDGYCSAVLKAPSSKPPIELPSEIAGEFDRVMHLLGY